MQKIALNTDVRDLDILRSAGREHADLERVRVGINPLCKNNFECQYIRDRQNRMHKPSWLHPKDSARSRSLHLTKIPSSRRFRDFCPVRYLITKSSSAIELLLYLTFLSINQSIRFVSKAHREKTVM